MLSLFFFRTYPNALYCFLVKSRVVRLATTIDVQAKLLIRVNLSAVIVSYQVATTIAVRTCLSRSLLTLCITVILKYAFYIVSCTLSNKHFRVRVRVQAYQFLSTFLPLKLCLVPFNLQLTIYTSSRDCINVCCETGPRLNLKTVFPRYGYSHVKDKTVARPFVFKMGIIILTRRHFYIEAPPGSPVTKKGWQIFLNG